MEGKTLSDRYVLESELGRGGMGVVYRARDPRLNREVAVKLIPPSMLTPEAEQRFQHEAQLVAQMDHPCIVPIHDYGRHEDSLFFVMPVIQGTNLRELMREGSLTLGELLDIGTRIAEALDYSHERGVVHRDIKPENVMVSREGGGMRVRVMDFGLARDTNVTRITRTGMLVGTMSYVSPEQVSGNPIDGRTDIYALGTVLYECATNDLPFSGELQSVLYRVVHELPRSPREQGAEIDESLEAIIMKCLAKDPEKRPQQAGEIARALQAVRSNLNESQQVKPMMATRSMAMPRPTLAPFVGRTDEMAELQRRLNQAIDGKCQFVVVSGEAGAGKSRVLDELENLARARSLRVLRSRFTEQEAAFPYYGFCEAIQDYYQQKETGSSSSGLPDLSDLAGELIALFPMLGELEPIRSAAGGSSPMAQVSEPRSPENRTQIFELLARTLTRLSDGKPMLMLLEDLHGADVSIEALQYVVRRLAPTPTLIVGTFRSTGVDRRHPLTKMLSSFRGDRQFESVALEPFSDEEHRAFLETLIGGNEIADGLARQLYEASEGNPFFTKELVRSLLDSGNIAQNDTGAWSLSGGMEISADALPATIQQAVEERVGRLPEELREILSVAAVMGKSFDFKDLETLAADAGDLDDAVDRLVQEGFVEEDRRSRGDRLVFSSGVVRDVLYGELSRRRRRSLHRRFAKELEKRHAGRLEAFYPQLLHHYAEGDVPEKAVEYGLLLARMSLESFSPEEAIRSSKAALEFLDKEWEGERSLEGEARMLLAEAHRLAGDVNPALKEIESANRIFEKENIQDRAVQAQLVAAKTAWQARRGEDTGRWVDRGIEAARAAGQEEALGEFLSLAATLANLRGEYAKANTYLQEAERLRPQPSGTEEEIPQGGRLQVPLTDPVGGTEPATLKFRGDWEIFTNVFETLLTTDAEGNLHPHLAQDWEVRGGGSSFLITLRPEVRFSDGQALTASALKATIEQSIRKVGGDLPAAFASLRGVTEFAEGKADDVAGIVAHADDKLELSVSKPLPMYPAFLTDGRSAAVRYAGSRPIGTGPFRVASHGTDKVVLERNSKYWRGTPPHLEAIEFYPGQNAATILEGFRAGRFDLAGDLLPQDLEQLLRETPGRRNFVEMPDKLTYFAVFNALGGPVASDPAVRKALAGVLKPHDLVYGSLGRDAHPAVGLLPPGILGHDPGKRRPYLSTDQARKLLESAGHTKEIVLHASIHPSYHERFGSLFQAVRAVWEELGVRVEVREGDMDSFLESWLSSEGLDLLMSRWGADYDDPETFTNDLFHSSHGELRKYCSSAAADEILEQARTETEPLKRMSLYRRLEDNLLEDGAVAPLFHAVAYRVGSPKIRGLKLLNSPPFVDYARVGKAESAAAGAQPRIEAGGVLRIPMTARVETLDPTLNVTAEQAEVLPCVFETLTRDLGEAQVVPWLASSFDVEDQGRSYRFRLRDDIRFHDGRRMTARDVRFSFERLLQNEASDVRQQYSPIGGAKALLEGTSRELTGFHIHSAMEFTLELEEPVAFFPVLLASPAVSIVPEGTVRFGGSWQEGTIGSGPFRVGRFDPGRTLELERNPIYWREGYPRSQGLVFDFGVAPKEIFTGFREGRFSLAADLFPADIEALRRDATYAAGYREKPRLVTYLAAFNIRQGVLADPAVRRRLIAAVDVDRLLRESLGRIAIPAHGLIPPGLLGHDASRGSAGLRAAAAADTDEPAELELTAAVHPIFNGEYAAFFRSLTETLAAGRLPLRSANETVSELVDLTREAKVDLVIFRWVADFPDTETFVHALHSEEGLIGRMCGSPELDRLIEKGRAETDPASRHSIYRQVEEHIVSEALLLPLFHEQVYRVARPDVQGLSVSYWSPAVAYENLRVRGS